MHDRIAEDRVFGIESGIPPPPLLSHRSTSFDLCSVRADGVETAYAGQGTVNHPPMVFVHGWGASHKFWLRSFSAFGPRRRCVAPDLPGFGLSEKPDDWDYSIEAFSRWLGAFLDQLNLDRVTLVGHSMGGTIALKFALDRPDRVERLALVTPVVRGATGITPTARSLMSPLSRCALFLLRRFRGVRRFASRDFTSEVPLPDELVDDILAPTWRSVSASYASLRSVDLSGEAPRLAPPTLAVGTDDDRIVAADQIDLVPTAKKVTVQRCGHIPMAERPEEFNRALDAFLRS